MVAVGFYMNLAPVFTYLGSLIFLHERFDLFVGLGMGMGFSQFALVKKKALSALYHHNNGSGPVFPDLPYRDRPGLHTCL